MRNEIYYGLKNALLRGGSLDEAVESFINAGYNPEEVHAAAEMLSSGALNLVHPETKKDEEVSNKTSPVKTPENPAPENIDLQRDEIKGLPSLPAVEMKKKKSHAWLVILILIIALVLIGIAGTIVYILYFRPTA
jgi:hypothetical protein